MCKLNTKVGLSIWLFLILSSLWSCSPDLDSMTVEQRALFQPNRFQADEKNDEHRNPLKVLEFIGIKPGLKVVDLFAGGGYYTELFDYLVDDSGKVYAQNHPAFIRFYGKELGNRLANNRLKNTQRIDSSYADLKLPKSVDLIFIALAYHDIYVTRKNHDDNANPELFYKQVFESLKPGGRLVIIDHAGVIGSKQTNTNKLHRVDEKWTLQNFEKTGFIFVSESNVLRNLDDDRMLNIWDKKVYHKTDRFIHMYQKPIK